MYAYYCMCCSNKSCYYVIGVSTMACAAYHRHVNSVNDLHMMYDVVGRFHHLITWQKVSIFYESLSSVTWPLNS